MSHASDTRTRASRLKLMAFDVDGVMTDGGLTYADDGSESKTFNVRDGLGLKLLQDAGITVAVITGRQAPCVAARMDNLGIEHVQQGIGDKLAALHTLLDRLGIPAEEAGYMGDDLIDLRAMAACGFSASPADGHRLARQYARFVCSHEGGRGAVREVCEFILGAQGKLEAALAPYLPSPAP